MADEKETLWQHISWWWTWRVWRPLRRRCSWCGYRLISEAEYDALVHVDEGTAEVSTPHASLGWGARACYGCCEYPDG